MTDADRIVVVGAGLIGCAIARSLVAVGREVVLVERDEKPGQRASSAAAGMLAPQMEGARSTHAPAEPAAEEAMLALLLESRARYPAFLRTMEAESGRLVPYRGDGTLVVALDARGRREIEDAAARQRARGLAAEVVDGPAARRLEPAIGPDVLAALRLPDDHSVDNGALVKAALAAAAARGARIETGAAVEAIESEAGAVTGVRVAGRSLGASVVVVAAGAWSGRLGGLPREVPVRPVRGQIGAVVPSDPPRRTVAGPGAYCVPRDDGRVLVGATMEEVGFDDGVSGKTVRGLVQEAARFLPGLAGAGEPEAWAGLRPATPDGLPILGPDPDLRGLIWATGHFRNGILLAPATAAAVTAVVTGAEPAVPIDAFRPARFR